jgi:hypothetical protein
MSIAQLDLFTDTRTVSTTAPGWGRIITSPDDQWRARWTGHRWGWAFYRHTTRGAWETWEPDLPHGVPYVLTRDAAETTITNLVDRYGDRPVPV